MSFEQSPLILVIEPPPPPPPPELVHGAAMARGADCKKCPLYGCNRGPVMGTIRPNAPLIAIGEAPGGNEVLQKEGFVGATGQILNQSIEKGGLRRADISISNVILCQPPEGGNFSEYIEALRAQHAKAYKKWERSWLGRPGDGELSPAKRHSTALKRYERARDEAKAAGQPLPEPPPELVLPQDCCRPRLERDMRESTSLVTLAVGKQALEQTAAILGLENARDKKRSDKPKVASLKKQHGAPVLMPDGKVLMATYHPAFAMRDKCEYMPVIRENIARAARIAKRNGAIDWTEPQYILNPTPEIIKRTLHRFLTMKAEITVDTETDSGDAHTCNIRCIGLGATIFGEEIVIVVPLRHMDGTLWWDQQTGLEIALLLQRVLDECELVFQNGQFDTTVLLRRRLMTRRDKQWDDTLLLHHDTPDNDLPHDLGFITRRYYECPLWKTDVDHKAVDVAGDYILHLYNARDVLATMRVVRPLRELVLEYNTGWQYQTDKKMAVKTRDMSELGLICNEWLRGKYSDTLNRRCTQLIREVQEASGRAINPRSPSQLRELLYGEWGYVPVVATDGYEWEEDVDDLEDGSTSNQALTRLQSERIALQDDPARRKLHHDAVEKLLEFRAVDKLRGTYTDNLKTYEIDGLLDAHFPGLVGWADEVRGVRYDAELDKDVEDIIIIPKRRGLSLVRTTYKGHVVPTGRLASGDPVNFQNVPKLGRDGLNLRDMYVAPPGHVLVGADYEQIEARLYAIIAQDQVLLRAIFGYDEVRGCQGHDIHALNAAALLCKPGETLMDVYRFVLTKPKAEKDYIRTVAKRFCIAEGELVLTDHGLIPIEQVQCWHKVWDGVEWVTHGGLIYQGEKEVIEYDGLCATPDHVVWREDGSKTTLGEAAARGALLARTGDGRDPVWFLDDHNRSLEERQLPPGDGPVPVRAGTAALPRQPAHRQVEGLHLVQQEALQHAGLAAGPIPVGEEPLHESRRPALGELRREGDRVPIRVGGSGRTLDDRQLRPGRPLNGHRPEGQQRPLRAGEPAVGHPEREPTQPARVAVVRKVRVYDLYCAGPRRRFTVSSRLVSNCFGLIYGAKWPKIFSVMVADRNKTTGRRTFPDLQERDCQEWEANWHRLHPETRIWHERCHAAFSTFGFVGVPMLDYRKRFFPGGVAQENAIPNLTIQGSAASIAARALLALSDEIPYRGWSYWSGVVLQVHDYIGVVVPESRAEEAAKLVEKCMYFEYNGMQFTAKAEITYSWGAQ